MTQSGHDEVDVAMSPARLQDITRFGVSE